MTKRMLIDGAHPEEARVVVTSANRLDEYDVETSTKRQIKGNIYLAKVIRVEPSLQAAFVDYGGDRHGFLAFNDVHPHYFQIPVEDREALAAEENAEEAGSVRTLADEIDGAVDEEDRDDGADAAAADAEDPPEPAGTDGGAPPPPVAEDAGAPVDAAVSAEADGDGRPDASPEAEAGAEAAPEDAPADGADAAEPRRRGRVRSRKFADGAADAEEDERPPQRQRSRRYKIQEVIKRRQIILVQVVKEERGNKGAALTTYISLAGRYCVLMPNTARGGGISRRITSAASRRKLKTILDELDIREGMGVIMRTAGMERNKSEIKRDFEYLLRAWDDIRDRTMESIAPDLIYEDASLVKRAIRDLYTRDVEEVLVEGADAYQLAKKFMRLMMPSHAKRVQPYRDAGIPLFYRYRIEDQLDAMHSPEVRLKSGGSIVIHSTEALVAVDVNSGRSTRERNIHETALKTNLEAADETARQLRLRDLAGLVVIDFIDMEESRHLRQVERRLKEAMKPDRARIQIGRISAFGLLELSRQRLRPSLQEASGQTCRHCHGSGVVRSTESLALRVLRAVEEEGVRGRNAEVSVTVPTAVALYVLNNKRASLADMEARYGFRVVLVGDDSVLPSDMRIERVPAPPGEAAGASAGAEAEAAPGPADEAAGGEAARERPRRRRSRRKGADRAAAAAPPEADPAEAAEAAEAADAPAEAAPGADGEAADGAASRRRRRGRRGGRKRSARSDRGAAEAPAEEAESAPGAGEAESAPQETPPADAGNGSFEPAAPPPPPVEPEERPEPAGLPPAPAPDRPRRRGWWQRLVE